MSANATAVIEWKDENHWDILSVQRRLCPEMREIEEVSAWFRTLSDPIGCLAILNGAPWP